MKIKIGINLILKLLMADDAAVEKKRSSMSCTRSPLDVQRSNLVAICRLVVKVCLTLSALPEMIADIVTNFGRFFSCVHNTL